MRLTNYWSFNGNIVDTITSLSLTSTSGYSFVSDRKGNANSAVYLNGSQWFSLPSAVYFSGPFSVTPWVTCWALDSLACQGFWSRALQRLRTEWSGFVCSGLAPGQLEHLERGRQLQPAVSKLNRCQRVASLCVRGHGRSAVYLNGGLVNSIAQTVVSPGLLLSIFPLSFF